MEIIDFSGGMKSAFCNCMVTLTALNLLGLALDPSLFSAMTGALNKQPALFDWETLIFVRIL